jgi:hypothetical protein
MIRQVPALLAFVAAMIPIVAFFIGTEPIQDLNDTFDSWLIIVAGFALPLGVVSFLIHHLTRVRKRQKRWPSSVISVTSFTAMALLGLFHGVGERPDGSLYPFTWLFQNMFNPLSATMFSLLAFMVASAAFRAFRVRSLEAGLLMFSGVLVMLGRVPLGGLIHPVLPRVSDWIMQWPNTAAQRGIMIGAALGAASMCIRVILGIERPYMGRGGKA